MMAADHPASAADPRPPSARRAAAPAPADADRVIVVGAGPSALALAVAVHLHKKGLPSVILERQDEASWTSQVRALGAHGFNFPIPEHFTSGREYLDSLLAYAEGHGIRPVFGTTVVSAVAHQAGPGLWRVSVNRRLAGNSGMEEEHEYVGRCLVVATGVDKDMRMVSQIPGLRDTFQGKVIHGSDYDMPGLSYGGKNVLVLGGGSTATTRTVAAGLIKQGAHPFVVIGPDDSWSSADTRRVTSTSTPIHGIYANIMVMDRSIGSVVHFLLAWLVVLLSGNVLNTHARALLHENPTIKLAGLLMCCCLFPLEKAMDFLERIGRLLSEALASLGETCRRPAERDWLRQVGLLVWYILSAVEISVKFFFVFVHCILFSLVFLASVLGLGCCDVAPPQLNSSGRLRVTATSFELLRLLMWYSLCVMVTVAQVIIEVLLFILRIDDIASGSGIDDVPFARGVTRFSESGVELADGRAIEIDVVVLATGWYGTNLPQAKWPQGCNVFANQGYPNTAFPQGWKGKSGLYSVGFTGRQGLSAASWGPVQIARHISQLGSDRQGPVSVTF